MRFGAMQGILRRSGRDLVEAAAALGFDGIELDLGRGLEDAVLAPGGAAALRAAADAAGLAVPSLCLGGLNGYGFKDAEPEVRARTSELIRRSLEAAGTLGARVLLIPFFGHSELHTAEDRARVARGLAEVAPEAERAGVALGLENTLSAAQDLELLEAIGSPAARIYFDVSNAMWWGHDSPTDLRRLGAAVVQVHFKDGRGDHSNAMLGQGHVDYPAVARALRDIGYDDWIVLESAAPHDPLQDAAANLAFARACVGADPAGPRP